MSATGQTAVLGYEYRVLLKRNRTAVLRLFEGRQVQRTDYVMSQVAAFAPAKGPLDRREAGLLADILDPNKTGYVTAKRIRELVASADVESEPEDAAADEFGSSLAVVSTGQKQVAAARQQQQARMVPPKRAPPMATASLYAVTTALALVPHAKDTSDPDMLAIMTAIQWSGRHLSNPTTIERRFYAATPLSRFAVPISARAVPSKRLDVAFTGIADALKRIAADQDRGWVAAALIATHVRAELIFRELVRLEVPEILVPEDVLQAFLATPRWYRMQVLDSSKTGAPHGMFYELTPVRLPLAVTALRVEMEAATRKVMSAFLPMDVAGAWARSSERERCSSVTALLDLDVFEDEFWTAVGGAGLEGILLTRDLMALRDQVTLTEEETHIRNRVEEIKKRIEEISAKAFEEETKKSSEIVFEWSASSAEANEDDRAIARVREIIADLHEDLLL